jgi:T5SS/PEP-CTERM-associated repeat protein
MGKPVITAPSSVTVTMGQATAIGGVSLSESGASAGETYTVELTDTNGALSATGSGVEGSGTDNLLIAGPLDNVNAALATLTDTDTTAASDTITIGADDSRDSYASTKQTEITAEPVTFDWNAGGGVWSSATNWTALTSGFSGPPAGAAVTQFGAGGGIVSGVGSAGTLQLIAGAWTMDGTISVTSSTLVGLGSPAGMTIDGGGTVDAGSAGVIAASAGSDGSCASVLGDDSTWQVGGTLDVGQAAEASLTVASDGTVTAASVVMGVTAGATGAIVVDGAGSSITDAGQLTVGDEGVGELSISNAGTVNAANANIGLQSGSSGNVDIEGKGSTFIVTGNLDVGDAGIGVLTVGAGATLDVAGNLNEGACGVVNIIGGVIDPVNGVLGGVDPLSNGGTLVYTGTLDLTGTVVLTNGTGELDVGTLTGAGALEIGDGGTFILADGNGGSSSTAVIGSDAPTIAFTGNAGTLTVEDASLLGTLEVMSFAAGDLIGLPNLRFASSVVGSPGTVELLDASGRLVGDVLYGGAVCGATLATSIVGASQGVVADSMLH